MAEAVEPTPGDSAEKAYAAAAELAISQADVAKAEPARDLEFPAKPKRDAAKPVSDTAVVDMAVADKAAEIIVPAELEAELVMKAIAPAKAAAAKTAAAKSAPAKAAKLAKPALVAAKAPVVAKKVAIAKPVVAKPAAVVKQAAVKKAVTKPVAVAKPAAPATPSFKIPTPAKPAFKEPSMTTETTKDFTATVKTAAADVQAKAKSALAKGSELLGEAGTFTKGNVEALVASGKILGTGLQELGKTYVAEGKSAYETLTADVKGLKAVKSPVEFVRFQTSLLRRNLDHAFDFGGKNSEAVIKLATDAIAPISARANLAIASVKKAA